MSTGYGQWISPRMAPADSVPPRLRVEALKKKFESGTSSGSQPHGSRKGQAQVQGSRFRHRAGPSSNEMESTRIDSRKKKHDGTFVKEPTSMDSGRSHSRNSSYFSESFKHYLENLDKMSDFDALAYMTIHLLSYHNMPGINPSEKYSGQELAIMLKEFVEKLVSKFKKFNLDLSEVQDFDVSGKMPGHKKKVLEVISELEKQLENTNEEIGQLKSHVEHLDEQLTSAYNMIDQYQGSHGRSDAAGPNVTQEISSPGFAVRGTERTRGPPQASVHGDSSNFSDPFKSYTQSSGAGATKKSSFKPSHPGSRRGERKPYDSPYGFSSMASSGSSRHSGSKRGPTKNIYDPPSDFSSMVSSGSSHQHSGSRKGVAKNIYDSPSDFSSIDPSREHSGSRRGAQRNAYDSPSDFSSTDQSGSSGSSSRGAKRNIYDSPSDFSSTNTSCRSHSSPGMPSGSRRGGARNPYDSPPDFSSPDTSGGRNQYSGNRDHGRRFATSETPPQMSMNRMWRPEDFEEQFRRMNAQQPSPGRSSPRNFPGPSQQQSSRNSSSRSPDTSAEAGGSRERSPHRSPEMEDLNRRWGPEDLDEFLGRMNGPQEHQEPSPERGPPRLDRSRGSSDESASWGLPSPQSSPERSYETESGRFTESSPEMEDLNMRWGPANLEEQLRRLNERQEPDLERDSPERGVQERGSPERHSPERGGPERGPPRRSPGSSDESGSWGLPSPQSSPERSYQADSGRFTESSPEMEDLNRRWGPGDLDEQLRRLNEQQQPPNPQRRSPEHF